MSPLKTKSTSKTKTAGTLVDPNLFGGGRRTDWLDMYNENPRLAVVHKIAEDNGSTAFSIKSKNKKSTFFIVDHPLQKEIDKHSVPEFFSLWTAYRLMQGVVFLGFDLVDGLPANFKIFTKMHVVKGGIGQDSFEFRYGNGTLTYPKNQVIIDTDLDLKNPYFDGKGKAEAIKDEIETDEAVQKYIKTFYFNSARPDLFVTAGKGEDMSESDISRLESEWYRKFQGINNAHKPVFLNWAANIFSVPTNHREMELLDTRKFYRDTTIQHFGVPPEIMGIVENSNKATVIAAEHIYAKQVRLPLLTHFETVINTQLMQYYPDSGRTEFAFDNIVPDDVEMQIKVAELGQKSMSITVNEWRVMFGFPKLVGDIGNTLIGTELPIGPVVTEQVEIESRNYKTYKEFVTDDFVDRASAATGKQLSGDTIIIFKEEDDSDAKAIKKRTAKSHKI